VIRPAETDLTAPYWAAARRGVVLLQRCDECALVWHPPAPICLRCRTTAWSWLPATGVATLHSWTCVVHSVHDQVRTAVPYLVGLVRLEEGPLFVCGIVGPVDDSQLADAAPVRIVLATSAGGEQLPMGQLV
jgi:uncharacterized OB-fold protein